MYFSRHATRKVPKEMHQRKEPTVLSFGNLSPCRAPTLLLRKRDYGAESPQSAKEPQPRRSAALAGNRPDRFAGSRRANRLAISVGFQPGRLTATGVAPTPLRVQDEAPT